MHARTAAPRALALALVLATAAAGCTPGRTPDGPPARAEAPRWTDVAVPAELTLQDDSAAVVGVVAATGDLPTLLAGTRTTADGGRVATWTRGDDGWAWVQPATRGERESRTALVVTDSEDTWLAGSSWAVGSPGEPFLMVSHDRRTWSDAIVPATATERGFAPQLGVVVDGAPVLVGVLADGSPATTAGDALLPLPDPGAARLLDGFTAVVADGAQVTAAATASRDGSTPGSVVYRSCDGGRTWAVSSGPEDGRSWISGLAVSGGGVVATGSTEAEDATRRAAAWLADGDAWRAEQLPSREEMGQGFAWDGETGTSLGAVVPDADGLLAAVTSRGDTRSGMLRRDDDGRWRTAGKTLTWLEPGVDALLAGGGDGVAVVQSSRGAARLGTAEGEGAVAPMGEVGTAHDAMGSMVFLDGARGPLSGSTTTVTTRADGWWSSANRSSPLTLTSPTALTASTWDPPGSEDLMQPLRASAPDGAQVVIGSTPPASEEINRGALHGWYRTGEQAPWTPMTGLESETNDSVSAVAATDDGWVAVGSQRASWDISDQDHTAVWTSGDGVAWQRTDEGTLADDGGPGGALDVCTASDGTALVVGYSMAAGGPSPRAWRRTGQTWQQVDLSGSGLESGWLGACATSGERTVVTGQSGQDAVALQVDDAVRRAAIGRPGDQVAPYVRPVDGGFAAAGTLGADGMTGAAVWLSPDGRRWQAITAPDGAAAAGSDVAVDGEDLVLTAVTDTGPRAWRLSDYRRHVSTV